MIYPDWIIVIVKENGGYGSTINASIGKYLLDEENKSNIGIVRAIYDYFCNLNVAELDYLCYVYRFGITEQSKNIKNMVKRINSHYKVLLRTLWYYQRNKSLMNTVIDKVIYHRLLNVIPMQYSVAFAIPDVERSYLHCKRYDRISE